MQAPIVMSTLQESASHTLNGKIGETQNQVSNSQEYTEERSAETSIFSTEGLYFYSGRDGKKLQNASLKRLRELQVTNDNLQRQINQISKNLNSSDDALTLLAEKERLQILISRNTGEIFKIHVENEERIKRITKLEAENKQLHTNAIYNRDLFIDTKHDELRTQFASEFFLAKSKIQKNTAELLDLTQD